jgi:hypothetical protein
MACWSSVVGQERTWKNSEGREIVARAVSKDDKSVVLRLQDGKRFSVEVASLSDEDQRWVAEWKAPVFIVNSRSVTAYKNSHRGPSNPVVVGRSFSFKSGYHEIEVFEPELKAVISALQKFLDLANKPLEDIKNYKQIIYQSNQGDTREDTPFVVFTVTDGKAYLTGGIVSGGGGRIPAKNAARFLDYLETFSPREWDARQKSIKERFE